MSIAPCPRRPKGKRCDRLSRVRHIVGKVCARRGVEDHIYSMAARRGTYQLREHWIGIVEHGPATERLCRSALRPSQPVMQYSDWPSTANRRRPRADRCSRFARKTLIRTSSGPGVGIGISSMLKASRTSDQTDRDRPSHSAWMSGRAAKIRSLQDPSCPDECHIKMPPSLPTPLEKMLSTACN